jgi:hypothetical protein
LGHYDRSALLQKTVKVLASRGKTDGLDQLTHRVLMTVDGPELQQMIAAGQFRLDAFDRLIQDLPGDHREVLQRALADNLFAAPLIDLKPADVLRGYPGSRTARQVQAWAKDPVKGHRLGILVRALRHHLEKETDLIRLRGNNAGLKGLGQFLADVGDKWRSQLSDTLRKLNIDPLG